MLSVEECRKYLDVLYNSLSDDKIKEIRDRLTEFINVLGEENDRV